MSLSKDDLVLLCTAFDEKTLGVKVQSLSKDKTKAMLVCYLQHTDVAARLDSVDPGWACAIMDEKLCGEGFSVRMMITLKGTSREGVGEGQDPKSAASDALKRTAMLFGVGRYLYDSETVWVPYNEQTDRFKQFSVADYKAALRPGQAQVPTSGPKPSTGHSPVTPIKQNQSASSPLGAMNRAQLGKAIDDLAIEIGLGGKDQTDWISDLYKKPLNRLTNAEMIEFHGILENEKQSKQERLI